MYVGGVTFSYLTYFSRHLSYSGTYFDMLNEKTESIFRVILQSFVTIPLYAY